MYINSKNTVNINNTEIVFVFIEYFEMRAVEYKSGIDLVSAMTYSVTQYKGYSSQTKSEPLYKII